MNYITTSRRVKARFKRAIKEGLPAWVQFHIESRMEYARRKWVASRDKAQAKEDREHFYCKAVNVLLSLDELLMDFYWEPNAQEAASQHRSLSAQPDNS